VRSNDAPGSESAGDGAGEEVQNERGDAFQHGHPLLFVVK